MPISIRKSPTADTRTCDWSRVSKSTLRESSESHILDVMNALEYFRVRLREAGAIHDFDKLSALDRFYEDFQTGFKVTDWWDNHRKVNRHHLNAADGVPEDVNLIDVLEHIADCVMAGVARSGSVYTIKLPDGVLQRAFANTVEMLKDEVRVEP
jgi:hypothetical protein